MKPSTALVFSTLLSTFLVTGCTTHEIAGSNVSSARPFSKSELTALLSGKTYPLSKGALYLHESGTVSAIWDGKKEDGAIWRVTDQSEFCYNLKMFGVEECLGLSEDADGNLIQDYDGNKRTLSISDLKEGKAF